MNQEQKEQINLNLSRLRFLKTDATVGANSALGAVALSGISKLSERHLEDVLLQVPETLPNGGERSLSNYEVVPLRSEVIGVAPIQNNVIEVHVKDPDRVEPVIKENLDNALKLIDCAVRWPPGKKDLVAFPEFFLTGYQDDCTPTGEGIPWTREDFLKVARTIPGEETDRLGEKAKQYNLYIAGCIHTKEEEWPDHHFHTNFLIGPNGKLIHKRWNAHPAPGVTEWATTSHDVLDEFIKRYGWDAVWPVAKTDIGNIATISGLEGLVPETWRAFAFRGAEIFTYMLSSMWTADQFKFLARAMSAVNNCYTVFCQPAKILNAKIHFESCYSYSTFILDNRGRIMREAKFDSEGAIYDVIPIALHRKGRSIPINRNSIYRDIYTNPKYEKNPPNLYLKYIPKDGLDAARYAKEKARW